MNAFIKLRRIGIILATAVFGGSLFAGVSASSFHARAQETDLQPTEREQHVCAFFGEAGGSAQDFGLVDQEQFDMLLLMMAELAENPSNTPIACRYALAEDVVWDTAVIPENLYIGVCLNGHESNGEFSFPASGNAGVFTYDCSKTHNCSSIGEDVMGIWQGQFDFLPYWMTCGGTLGAIETTAFALMSDITFSDFYQGMMNGGLLSICCNGYSMQGEEKLGARITKLNCLSDGELHVCEALGDGLHAIGLGEVPKTGDNVIQEVIQSGNGGTKTIITKVKDSFTPYVDGNGVFIGHGTAEQPEYGTYAFSLREDISLAKTLVIPAGMDVHICLNGHTLLAPEIRLYKDSKRNITSTFTIQDGGSLTICDCSADGDGMILSNLSNFEAETEGGWDGLGAAIAIILTHVVYNEGTVTVNGGNIVSIIGMMNQGDIIINGGSVSGALSSVILGVNEQMGAVAEDCSLTLNGGAVAGGVAGVMGMHGEVTINDGVVQAYTKGIVLGQDLNGDPVEGETCLNVNGGSIVFDTALLDIFIETGFAEVLGNVNMDELLPKDTSAVDVGGNLNLNTDIDVVFTEEFLAAQQKSADLDTAKRQEEADSNLAEGETSVPVEPTQYAHADFVLSETSVLGAKEGVAFENQYTIVGTGSPSISEPDQEDLFVPMKGFFLFPDGEGSLILVPKSEEDPPVIAKGATVSTDGTIRMNFYLTTDEKLISKYTELRVVLKMNGNVATYAFDQGAQKADYRVFSIGVAAKDYQKSIVCSVVGVDTYNNMQAWDIVDVTLLQYLNLMLEDTTGAYNDAKDLCRAMKNYCMAASVLFGESVEYTYPDMQQYMDMVTADVLQELAMSYTGSSEVVELKGATLLLESMTAIRIYFTLGAGVALEDVAVSIDGESIEAVLENASKKMYYVEVSNIAAVDLWTMYSIEIDGYTVNYSAMSYAYSVLATQNSNAKSITVVKALAVYCAAANEYFA